MDTNGIIRGIIDPGLNLFDNIFDCLYSDRDIMLVKRAMALSVIAGVQEVKLTIKLPSKDKPRKVLCRVRHNGEFHIGYIWKINSKIIPFPTIYKRSKRPTPPAEIFFHFDIAKLIFIYYTDYHIASNYQPIYEETIMASIPKIKKIKYFARTAEPSQNLKLRQKAASPLR